jgi:geranylgeranyl diphosphate synthase type II
VATDGSGSLERYLEGERRRIDAALAAAVAPLGTPPAVFHEALRYTLLLPGKRLRGIVTLASADVFRGGGDGVLAAAAAVEMVHAASLILDDLPSMDDASVRRGQPTLHRAVGEANAILAAVGLLNAAYALVLGTPGLTPRRRVECAARLAAAVGADGLIGGQVQDLAGSGQRLDLEALEWIHSHKTGALFIAAAEMGARCAGARAAAVEAVHRYAKNLGLAFQITDDLLDYSGNPATTGKDGGQDRDRTTFVNLCGIDGARRLVDELIDAAVGALAAVGKRAERLRELAEFVRTRDH